MMKTPETLLAFCVYLIFFKLKKKKTSGYELWIWITPQILDRIQNHFETCPSGLEEVV